MIEQTVAIWEREYRVFNGSHPDQLIPLKNIKLFGRIERVNSGAYQFQVVLIGDVSSRHYFTNREELVNMLDYFGRDLVVV